LKIKISNKWLALSLVSMLTATLVISGCPSDDNGNGGNPTNPTETALSGTITIAGSTTVQPLSELLAEAFMQMHPQVTITVQGGGSSVGVQSAVDEIVDIGAASRNLKSSEEGTVIPTPIALDGIALVVNSSSSITGLTLEQARDIFSGVITNWNQVGGLDEEIVVISREEGSGTRGAFEDLVMDDELITESALLFQSNGAVRTALTQTPNSVAYLSFGYLDDSVTPLAVDGVDATTENITNGTYPVFRPLLYVTKTEPVDLVKTYIDFCLGSQGQTIVEDEGYLRVS
jgi:phosphate transport system substrate-binding protein